MSFVVAVDVGGTSMKAARVDASGAVVGLHRFPTPAADGPEAVVAAVRSAVLAVMGADVSAVGVVVPGVVDVASGVARYSTNLRWRDVPLASLISADTGLPVAIEHDVRAAGLAERRLGGAQGLDDCLVVVIGTGIAGVLITDGRPVVGATSLAGEVGHVPVYPDGDECACGQRGCLETYASAAAIARRYAARTGVTLDAAEIASRLSLDPAAALTWDLAARSLGIALATCTMLLDPAAIVLSGGLSAAGEVLRDPVAAELASRLVWRPAPPISLSPLGGLAGLHGAALLARGLVA